MSEEKDLPLAGRTMIALGRELKQERERANRLQAEVEGLRQENQMAWNTCEAAETRANRAEAAAGAAIGATVRSGQPAHPTAAALAEWRELALAVDGYPLWHVEPSRDAAGMMSVRAGHWKDDWDDDDGRHGEFVCDGCTSLEAAYIAHSSPDRILALLAAYEAERARADALMAMLHSGTWLRYAGRTDLAVRMPDGADLSCKAMREDAINKALAALVPKGAGHDE